MTIKYPPSKHYRSKNLHQTKILLLKLECRSNEFIADKLDICVIAVRLCIDKYNTSGIVVALQDNKGRRRKAKITDADITWVINKACQKLKDFGYSVELQYPASFTCYINSIAEQEGHPRMASVTEITLHKILANAEIRPFKISYYCERCDPDFDSKMHVAFAIYKQLSLHFDGLPVHTLFFDEKTRMQVLDITADDKPPVSGIEKSSMVYRNYEYVRLGMLSLFVAVDLFTGKAVPLVSPTHRSSDFVRFLKMLDGNYPAGDKIRLILDNHFSYALRETQEHALNKEVG